MIGKTFGKYVIQNIIKSGGIAHIYKASDPITKDIVAIKILQPGTSRRTIKGFIRETKMLKKLNYPNIIRVMDFGKENGMPYMVMEYINGEDLKKLFLHKKIKKPQISNLILQIGRD